MGFFRRYQAHDISKTYQKLSWGGVILISLATAGTVNAAVITPTSYNMLNGDTGAFNYWDKNYTGSGNTTQDNAPLTGGLGDLTDGIIPTQNWFSVENTSPPGEGPYVGWTLNPTITFNFNGVVNIDTVTVYVDDSNGFGSVSVPASVNLSMGSSSFNSGTLTDPPTSTPTSYTFSGLGFSGSSLQLTLNRRNQWVFASEVTFEGSTNNVTVPEPSTILGLGILGFGAFLQRKLAKAKKSNKQDK